MSISKMVIFSHPLGLHARPATLWVNQINAYECEVRIRKGLQEANGRSVIELMLLHVAEGDELHITMDGSDESAAMSCFERFLKHL